MSPRNTKTVLVGDQVPLFLFVFSSHTVACSFLSQSTLKVELRKAKESDACLVVMRGPGLGQRFVLNGDEAVVGRDPGVAVSLVDQSVSRRHAQVSRELQKEKEKCEGLICQR